MKILLFLSLICLNICASNAQDKPEILIKRVADLILRENVDGLIDKETGLIINDPTNIPEKVDLAIASKYRKWGYWNGVVNIAMLEMYKQFNDSKYRNYTVDNYNFVFDNYELLKNLLDENRMSDLDQHWNISALDHCGAMASGLIETYRLNARKDYLPYLEIVADYMLHKEHRLNDGTLARIDPYDKTLWLDDLYMSVPFLARMGNLTSERKYFDFAAKQVIQFTKYLYDEKSSLYFHCYYDNIKEKGVAHWGRANGWCILAQANLLEFLPKDHPDRPELLRIFKQQIIGFSRYQSETGLWHQLLDKEDSFLETSCTAMFTYAVAKGINEKWIEPRYKTIALEGWKGIASMINDSGQVANTCVGTSTSTSTIYYYKRPVSHNDIHGLGAVLLAGLEVGKLPDGRPEY